MSDSQRKYLVAHVKAPGLALKLILHFNFELCLCVCSIWLLSRDGSLLFRNRK